MHPLESLDSGIELFVSGSVFSETELALAKGAPKPPAPPRVERVAVKAWAVGGEKEGAATVTIITELASYLASKPSAAYKKLHQPALGRAVATRETLRALSADVCESADPSAPLQQVCANISRTSGQTMNQAKETLVRAGKHILAALRERDVASGAVDVKGKGKGKAAAVVLSETLFAASLAEEMATFTSAAALLSNAHAAPGGIVIREGGAPAAAEAAATDGKPTTTSTAQMTADEAMARALFEQEMAREEGKARKSIKRAAASAAGGDGCARTQDWRCEIRLRRFLSLPSWSLC